MRRMLTTCLVSFCLMAAPLSAIAFDTNADARAFLNTVGSLSEFGSSEQERLLNLRVQDRIENDDLQQIVEAASIVGTLQSLTISNGQDITDISPLRETKLTSLTLAGVFLLNDL